MVLEGSNVDAKLPLYKLFHNIHSHIFIIQFVLHGLVIPKTSKKLEGHFGFGLSVRSFVRSFVRSLRILMHAICMNREC